MIHKRSLSESRHRATSGSSLVSFDKMFEADTVDSGGGGDAPVTWQDVKKTLKNNPELTSKLHFIQCVTQQILGLDILRH